MKTDTVTLNIVILPDEKVRDKVIEMSKLVSSRIPTHFILGKEKIPHITVYQAAFPSKNIEKIKSVISKTSHNTPSFNIKMGKISISHETFLFWECIKSDDLINLHNKIVEKLNPIREGNIIGGIPNQSAEDKYDMENYGSLLIGPRYSPHITITRIKKTTDQKTAIKTSNKLGEMNFNVKNIILGELEDHGTVTQVISTLKLLS